MAGRAEGVKAVIFDMDGVLVDTEIAYLGLFEEFFGDRGLDLDWAELCQVVGASTESYKEHIGRWFKRTPELTKRERRLGSWKAVSEYCQENFPPYSALIFPGVPETLAGLKEQGLRLAVASSSSMGEIESVTEECGISQYFELLVSGEDLPRAKPDPGIYLKALDLLGLPAEECVAVEDSDPGIASALAAGLRVAVKRDDRFFSKQEGGSWYVDDLEELLGILG